MAPSPGKTRYFASAGYSKSSRISVFRVGPLLLLGRGQLLQVDLDAVGGDQVTRLHVGRARAGPLRFLDRRRFALSEERRIVFRLDFGSIRAVARVADRRVARLLRSADLTHGVDRRGAPADAQVALRAKLLRHAQAEAHQLEIGRCIDADL